MRLYLDNCCYNRPWDDQTQIRIRREAESVLYLTEEAHSGKLTLVTSDYTLAEIMDMPDLDRQAKVLELVSVATAHISERPEHYQRAETLLPFGIQGYDALHLLAAEEARVDYFLTTDDRLLNQSQRASHLINLTALNPQDWPPVQLIP